MKSFEIIQIPAWTDNYIYLLHDLKTKKTAVIDPTEAEPVLKALKEKKWNLDLILNTHHHPDHIGGNESLKKETGAQVCCSLYDQKRISSADHGLKEGDEISIGSLQAQVLEIPGHTLGHIAFYFKKEELLFCGDTLFSLGCGRLFEGSPEQMWTSLVKIRNLPSSTQVYCAHEYTLKSCEFALHLSPEPDLLKKKSWIEAQRSQGRSTVPSLLGEEKALNPFLKADQAEYLKKIGITEKDPIQAFRVIRERKDCFR